MSSNQSCEEVNTKHKIELEFFFIFFFSLISYYYERILKFSYGIFFFFFFVLAVATLFPFFIPQLFEKAALSPGPVYEKACFSFQNIFFYGFRFGSGIKNLYQSYVESHVTMNIKKSVHKRYLGLL